MVVIVERNGIRYAQTSVQVPVDLKEFAKVQKISLSRLLTEALRKKVTETVV